MIIHSIVAKFMRRGPGTSRVVVVYNAHTVCAKILDHAPFGVVMSKFQTPRPLNMAIYRPKLASILIMPHLH